MYWKIQINQRKSGLYCFSAGKLVAGVYTLWQYVEYFEWYGLHMSEGPEWNQTVAGAMQLP